MKKLNSALKAPVVALMASCALAVVPAAAEEPVLFTDQSEKLQDDKLKDSIEHGKGVVKLINERNFEEAGKLLQKGRGMGLGLDVFERASRNEDWKGVIKLVRAKHDRKNDTIEHLYSFDGGHGFEMYFWMFYDYDKDGLKKPRLFAGGC